MTNSQDAWCVIFGTGPLGLAVMRRLVAMSSREPVARRDELVSGLSNGRARDQDLLPATSRTAMHGHDRRGDQANRIFGQRPDHLLAPLTANQLGFALLFSHGRVLKKA